MKKIIVILSLVILVMVINTKSTEDLIIPSEAIRIRVIANSDSTADQLLKKKIREDIQTKIMTLVEGANNADEARNVIRDNMEIVNKTIEETLKNNNSKEKYQVNYGNNHFPEKRYKGVVYEEGYYESIVITLGEGNGDNWWCILFPPLCLMEADNSDISKVEYKSFFKEVIDRYFKN